MASKLSLKRFARKDFGRLLLRTLMKFCGASLAIGAFVGLVGFLARSKTNCWALPLLAGLTAGAFPAWRGARLSPVWALRHG